MLRPAHYNVAHTIRVAKTDGIWRPGEPALQVFTNDGSS